MSKTSEAASAYSYAQLLQVAYEAEGSGYSTFLRSMLQREEIDLEAIIDGKRIIAKLMSDLMKHSYFNALKICLQHHSVTVDTIVDLKEQLERRLKQQPSELGNKYLALINEVINDSELPLLKKVMRGTQALSEYIGERAESEQECFTLINNALEAAITHSSPMAVDNILQHPLTDVLALSHKGESLLRVAIAEWQKQPCDEENTATLWFMLHHHSALHVEDTRYFDSILQKLPNKNKMSMPPHTIQLKEFVTILKYYHKVALAVASTDAHFTACALDITLNSIVKDPYFKRQLVSGLWQEAHRQGDEEIITILKQWYTHYQRVVEEHLDYSEAAEASTDDEGSEGSTRASADIDSNQEQYSTDDDYSTGAVSDTESDQAQDSDGDNYSTAALSNEEIVSLSGATDELIAGESDF